MENIKVFLKNKKTKNENINMSNIKIFQKMKTKTCIEKHIMKYKKKKNRCKERVTDISWY